MNEPLISIVVPTKNRYFYLKKLIETVSKFENLKELELIIQDNSEDNSEILNFFKEHNYPFIKYFYTQETITISKNCDLAIRNSSGEYVTFIGDDDGICQDIIECCNKMQSMDIECVVPKGFYYNWPKSTDGKGIGKLSYVLPDKKFIIYDTSVVLDKALNCGLVDRSNLPLLYHGIVKRSTLEKIWAICGTYFPGASPDIANGIALSLVMNKFATVTYPYVYGGASEHLGGDMAKFKHNATTDFSKLPFLPKNIESIWDTRIPKVWSSVSIWCESGVEALKAMGRFDLTNNVNFEKMYAEFILFFPYYKKLAYTLSKNKCKLRFEVLKKIIKRYKRGALKKLKLYKLQSQSSLKRYQKNGIKDIESSNFFLYNLWKDGQ